MKDRQVRGGIDRRTDRRVRAHEPASAGTLELLQRAWRSTLGNALPRVSDAATSETKMAGRLLQIFEASGKGWFWETDREGRLVYLTGRVSDRLNLDHAKVMDSPFTGLLAEGGGQGEATARSLAFYLSSRTPFTDVIVRARAKEEIWWSVSGNPVTDKVGRFFGFCGFATDLTEHRRSEVELDRLARCDSLTGLPNRAMMRRYLEDALWSAARRRHRCAVFLLDLDRFKAVNDTLGHPIGDTLLRLAALRLKEAIGQAGQIGRIGGDEFQAVLGNLVDEEQLSTLAQRVIDHVAMPYTIGAHVISIGASIGIVASDYDDRTADDLIRDADLALYAAKAAGKGRYRFFVPEMHAGAQQRQQMEADLRCALQENQLSLFYQPSVNLKTEEVVGFEALIRWQHPVRGWISPSEFIPLAEETGLIIPIGEWVLRTACAEAAPWPPGIRIAVNLSPVQFTSPSLPSVVASVLSSCGLPADRLELEITEGVLLNDDEGLYATIGRLKAIGVKLALDDFGTGYSSLSYLPRVQFDKIKIDQSFVRGASIKGSKNSAIIRAVVGLARELSMETTAEGVETHDELALVKKLGCSLVQGYIYGKPMPADEAGRLVSRHASITASGFLCARADRRRLLKLGSMMHDSQFYPIRVRNVSAGGAMVQCSAPMEVGASVQLDIGIGEVVAAEVQWARDDELGFRFATPLDLKSLQKARSGSRVLTPAYLKSSLFSDLLRPEGKAKLNRRDL